MVDDHRTARRQRARRPRRRLAAQVPALHRQRPAAGADRPVRRPLLARATARPAPSTRSVTPLLGQTCKNLGGDFGQVCANAVNPAPRSIPATTRSSAAAPRTTARATTAAAAAVAGIINVLSRTSDIHPQAIFDVRGADGGICPICSGEAGGGAGELQIDSAYVGEICDGFDNDFDGMTDDGPGHDHLPRRLDDRRPASAASRRSATTPIRRCAWCRPRDARPRFALIVDTSGSMLNDLVGLPDLRRRLGRLTPASTPRSDADAIAGNNSRLFIAKDALTQVLVRVPGERLRARALLPGRRRQPELPDGVELRVRGELLLATTIRRNNLPPTLSGHLPGQQLRPVAALSGGGLSGDARFHRQHRHRLAAGGCARTRRPAIASTTPARAGRPGAGAQFVVGFNEPINRYLDWLDGVEDDDAHVRPRHDARATTARAATASCAAPGRRRSAARSRRPTTT